MKTTTKLFRGKFIRNYRNGNKVLMIHANKTKPIWLFINMDKKPDCHKVTKQEAIAFIQELRNK
jgi:hypothetical protein